jgi:hypothetical protein
MRGGAPVGGKLDRAVHSESTWAIQDTQWMTLRNDLGRFRPFQTHGPAIRAPGSTASVERTPLPNHGWSNKVWTVLCSLGGGSDPPLRRFSVVQTYFSLHRSPWNRLETTAVYCSLPIADILDRPAASAAHEKGYKITLT